MKLLKTKSESSGAVAAVRGRSFFGGMLLAGILVAAGALPEPVFAAPPASAFRTDRILIKPKEGISLSVLSNLNARLGGRIMHRFSRMGNLHVIRLPQMVSVPNAIAFFQRSGLVKYAEPDYFVNALAEPNDFHYLNGDLWNLNNLGQYGGTPYADINATNGWDYQTSASNVIVAVIDTGVRYTHEDLAANMWHNPQVNQDGYTNDLYGINLVNNGHGTGDPWDDYGHGTHVAGIIGAAGNNGVGIAGVCWQVQLMALKFIDVNGNGSISDAITCMDYARSHGAKIINASWGSYDFTSAALQDAINSLRDAGIIFVAAAGNDGNNNDANSLFPASYNFDNVIAVAASDRNDNLAWFSNFGLDKVKIAAPGIPVFSCWNGSDSDYENYQGTSMAAPHVAGACALVWAKYPNLSMQQVIRRVLNGADPLPGLTNMCVTGGRLDLGKALKPPPQQQSVPPAVTVWMDDVLPGGAETNDPGGDSWTAEPWNWVTNNPAPFSGAASHQSELISGIHEHSFQDTTNTLEVFPGDTLFTYIYLDPVNPPREIMIEWNDGCWEHRAFWGENLIQWGEYGTSDRLDMGDLPPAGQWVRLEVPAHALQLEGAVLKGMSFMLYDGRATWDFTGRRAASDTPTVAITTPANNAPVSGTINVSADASLSVVGMQFKLDEDNLGFAVLGAPYNIVWNTTTATNGPHVLTAVAFDRENNQTTSSPVTVTVNNNAPAQNLFVADSYNDNILEFTPDGTRTIYASGFGGTTAFGFDQSGNLFVGNGSSIYKVAPDGTQSIFGESGTNGGPLSLAVDQAGDVFEGNGNGNVYKFTPDGTRSVFAAGSIGYDRPWALTFDGAGNLFESDIPYSTYSSHIYEYAPDGTGMNYTINAVIAAFGMVFDSAGNLFVADARNQQVIKIAPDKSWSTIASGFDLPYGVAVDAADNVFVSDANQNTIYKIAPDGAKSVFATGLNHPTVMVFASPPGH